MIPITNPNLPTIALEHYTAVEEQLKRKRINKFTLIDHWIQSNLNGISLKDVILAIPQELDRIVKISSVTKQPHDKNILYLKQVYDVFAQSSKCIGNNDYNASQLVKKLGLKVCPYCNRNYVNNVKLDKKMDKVRRTCQIDHFHNKDAYPVLAMSFFNLIPSCPSCNHLKSTNSVFVSPYHQFDVDSMLKFDYRIKNARLAGVNDISTELKSTKEFSKNITVFRLDDHYKEHTDVIYELIRKKQMYPKTRIDELYTKFDKLFNSREEFVRTLYGNYLEKHELSNRPLSKLTRDLYINLN